MLVCALGCFQTQMELMGRRQMLHVKRTAAPPIIGVPGVLLKKVLSEGVPDVEDINQAQDIMPQYLHLTYFHQDTHRSLHSVFNQVRVCHCMIVSPMEVIIWVERWSLA